MNAQPQHKECDVDEPQAVPIFKSSSQGSRFCPWSYFFCLISVNFQCSHSVLQNIDKSSPASKHRATQVKNIPTVALRGWQNCLYTLKQIWALNCDFKRTFYRNEHVYVCVNSRTASQTPFPPAPWYPSSCFHLTGFSFKSPDSDNFPLNPFRGAPRLTL